MQDLNTYVPKLILSSYGGWKKALTISAFCHSSLALILFNQIRIEPEPSPVPLNIVELHFITKKSNQPELIKPHKINTKTPKKYSSSRPISKSDPSDHVSSAHQSISANLLTLTPNSSNHPPIYPISARQGNIEGTVHLKVIISGKGVITSVQVLSPKADKILEQAALQAVNKWTFKPHPLGLTVEAYIPIRFKLEG